MDTSDSVSPSSHEASFDMDYAISHFPQDIFEQDDNVDMKDNYLYVRL